MCFEMKLFFVRHGQGKHNTNIPDRLNIEHPHLTEKGIKQVANLISKMKFNENDVFIVSPTVRTIETAKVLTKHLKFPKLFISPLVGPRVFPLKEDSKTVKCDITLPITRIEEKYSEFTVLDKDDTNIWNEGINIISDDRFYELGERMIDWIKEHNADRTFVISHDGTITNYRKLIGEQGLTRSDFLGEAGTYKIIL
jgi:broad specificity phosphatase PhoE